MPAYPGTLVPAEPAEAVAVAAAVLLLACVDVGFTVGVAIRLLVVALRRN